MMVNLKKTKAEILSEIETERSNLADLSAINNTSAASVYGQLMGMVATVAFNLRNLLQDTYDVIAGERNKMAFGSEAWYVRKILEFQFGYDVAIINGETGYTIIANQAKIIKSCKVNEMQDANLGYVLRVNITPDITKTGSELFTTIQLATVKAYINQIKILGTQVVVTQLKPDWLRVLVEVKYNRLLTDNTGRSLLTGAYPVKEALTEFVNDTLRSSITTENILSFMANIPEVLQVTIRTGLRKYINNDLATIEPLDSYSLASEAGVFKLSADSVITYV